MSTKAGEVTCCFNADAGIGAGDYDGFTFEGGSRIGSRNESVREHARDKVPADVNWPH